MPITREDVVRARTKDRFVDKTGMGWEILDKWSEIGGAFCFELYFPNYKPVRISYNEGVFRIVGETPFALDDLNHPGASFEKRT